jgi:hypothetical protein
MLRILGLAPYRRDSLRNNVTCFPDVLACTLIEDSREYTTRAPSIGMESTVCLLNQVLVSEKRQLSSELTEKDLDCVPIDRAHIQ